VEVCVHWYASGWFRTEDCKHLASASSALEKSWRKGRSKDRMILRLKSMVALN